MGRRVTISVMSVAVTADLPFTRIHKYVNQDYDCTLLISNMNLGRAMDDYNLAVSCQLLNTVFLDPCVIGVDVNGVDLNISAPSNTGEHMVWGKNIVNSHDEKIVMHVDVTCASTSDMFRWIIPGGVPQGRDSVNFSYNDKNPASVPKTVGHISHSVDSLNSTTAISFYTAVEEQPASETDELFGAKCYTDISYFYRTLNDTVVKLGNAVVTSGIVTRHYDLASTPALGEATDVWTNTAYVCVGVDGRALKKIPLTNHFPSQHLIPAASGVPSGAAEVARM